MARRFQLGGDGAGTAPGARRTAPSHRGDCSSDPAEGCGALRPSLVRGLVGRVTRGPGGVVEGRGEPKPRAPRSETRWEPLVRAVGRAPRKPPGGKRGWSWGCGGPPACGESASYSSSYSSLRLCLRCGVPGSVASHRFFCSLNPDALTLVGFPILNSPELRCPHPAPRPASFTTPCGHLAPSPGRTSHPDPPTPTCPSCKAPDEGSRSGVSNHHPSPVHLWG